MFSSVFRFIEVGDIVKIKKTMLVLEKGIKDIIRFLFKDISLWFCTKKDYHKFPIYIISYNRLSYVRQTIEWLEKYGYNNITIIDNNSDYEPLLHYLSNCKHKVIRLKKNYGFTVFYKCPRFFFKSRFSYYALTDPDLAPIDDCPGDFVKLFLEIMSKENIITKVGFSLKIDDIPDDYYLKDEVVKWESNFYDNKEYFNGVLCYRAPLDTTFSVNAPFCMVPRLSNEKRAIRTGAPYQLRHLPWYITKRDNELENYCNTIRTDITNWNGNFSKEDIRERI